jgi:putative Holliday junction resolvase
VGTVLAIDPGTRYIGLAISNPEGTMAFPHEVVPASKTLVPDLLKLIQERDVSQVIIGRPLALRGTVLPMTQIAEDLAAQLTEALKSAGLQTQVQLVDERLSTREAGQHSGAARLDAAAAAIILQTHLDSQARRPKPAQ